MARLCGGAAGVAARLIITSPPLASPQYHSWAAQRWRGLLYVGDCKIGALEIRAFVQAGGDDYLCPLSELQMPAVVLAAYVAPVWTGKEALTPIAWEICHRRSCIQIWCGGNLGA